MGCGSCATMGCGSTSSLPTGCKNNGNCQTGGCNKLNTFDWLSDMDIPGVDPFSIVEVKFKAGRKDFFRNTEGLDLNNNDPVVVQMQSGYHIGFVSLQGELVKLQMKKKKVEDDENIKVIYRKASERDLEKFQEAQDRDLSTMYRAREIALDLELSMKLTDVEFQADNTKATFFYSAEARVDFRELIKILASEFKIRIEMKQISIRQEAGRLGGIGSCGRELCCSTWLTDFKSVSTGAARYQNLSLNPTKLSGQCGRLKCCLNYELETYLDALIDIPKVDQDLLLERGLARLQKTDIFKKTMWFSFENDTNWYPLTTDRVNEIIALNKKGIKPPLDPEKPVDKKPKRKARTSSKEIKQNTSGHDKSHKQTKNIKPDNRNKRFDPARQKPERNKNISNKKVEVKKQENKRQENKQNQKPINQQAEKKTDLKDKKTGNKTPENNLSKKKGKNILGRKFFKRNKKRDKNSKKDGDNK